MRARRGSSRAPAKPSHRHRRTSACQTPWQTLRKSLWWGTRGRGEVGFGELMRCCRASRVHFVPLRTSGCASCTTSLATWSRRQTGPHDSQKGLALYELTFHGFHRRGRRDIHTRVGRSLGLYGQRRFLRGPVPSHPSFPASCRDILCLVALPQLGIESFITKQRFYRSRCLCCRQHGGSTTVRPSPRVSSQITLSDRATTRTMP
ncbi:hypothetical protein V8E53_014896 [Lactarius tabidus]